MQTIFKFIKGILLGIAFSAVPFFLFILSFGHTWWLAPLGIYLFSFGFTKFFYKKNRHFIFSFILGTTIIAWLFSLTPLGNVGWLFPWVFISAIISTMILIITVYFFNKNLS